MAEKRKKGTQQAPQKIGNLNPSVKRGIPTAVPEWAIWAVLAFTAIIYLSALFNGFVNLDDDAYITKNPYLRDFSFHGVKAIFSSFYNTNYHPLTTLVYLLEFQMAGLNPFLYHLLDIILHLVNVWLVFKLTEKLSGKSITAIVVAILFAIHPMHVESVAWVSELKDVLYSFFYLLSLLAYLRFLESDKKIKYYFVTVLYFVLSLLSKSAAVTLPVLLIAFDIYKGRPVTIKSLLEKIPFLLLSALFGILAIYSQHAGSSANDITLVFSFIDRIFLFTYTLAFYITMLVVPVNMAAMHYYPNDQPLPYQFYASLPLLLLLIWLVIRRSSFRKEIVFGVFFFLVTISVMLQVVHVGFALAAERYTYIPYIGLFYFTGQWISSLWKKPHARNTIVAIFFLFVAFFSFQTWTRIGVWKNGEVLFTDIISKNPEMYHSYWTRGSIRYNKNDFTGALQDFNKAMYYNPQFVLCLVVMGDVKNKLNDFAGALEDMDHAILMDSTNPDAYFNRGEANEELGNGNAALLDYNKVLRLDSNYFRAYNKRGVLKAKSGDFDGAIKDINVAISFTPNDATLYSYRGNVWNFKKDYNSAIKDFNYALKLQPEFAAASYNRGMSRYYLNDINGACEDWKKAAESGDKIAAQTIQQYCK